MIIHLSDTPSFFRLERGVNADRESVSFQSSANPGSYLMLYQNYFLVSSLDNVTLGKRYTTFHGGLVAGGVMLYSIADEMKVMAVNTTGNVFSLSIVHDDDSNTHFKITRRNTLVTPAPCPFGTYSIDPSNRNRACTKCPPQTMTKQMGATSENDCKGTVVF